MKRLRRLTLVTVGVTYLLVAVGGLVRATESGLGCGDDWPRCRGRIVPAGDHHTWIEFGHRAIAAVLVALVAVLAVLAWRHARQRRDLLVPALVCVPLVLAQAGLGAVVVVLELEAVSVVAHLALALGLFAVVLALAVHQHRPLPEPSEIDRVAVRALALVALGVLATVLLGSYVSGREAGLAFRDWPTFDGGALPDGRGFLGWLHGAHRLLAAASGLSVAWLAWWMRRRGSEAALRRLVVGAGVALAALVLLGAANVWTELSAATRTAHLAIGALIWALLVTAVLAARRTPAPATTEADIAGSAASVSSAGDPEPFEPLEPLVPRARLARARAYFLLTKPRVIELLLVTTVPAMVLASGGLPSPWLVLSVLLGGSLAAGGANTINCYIDRHRDREMHRTRRRPLPTGEIDPVSALRFGLVLEVAAFGWLWFSANLLAAALAVSATVFYVFVYSIWLKPRTAQNIVVGGAAGAVPVLVGWAAVTSAVAWPAWVLFAIIFVWTPPHFWALALRYRDDYAAAGVPMLPVVAGIDATTRQILAYSLAVVATTLALFPVAGMSGLYLGVALALGVALVWRALQLRRDATQRAAMRMFSFSNVYLALLFAAVALDVVVVGSV